MIPRYQRILFWILTGAVLMMALFLLHGCEQAREKLTRRRNETPLVAPVTAPSETVRLAMANDADGSITMVDREIALPSEATARAHALLARLVAEYSYKNSAHPIESGPAIDDVFLLELPLRPAVAPTSRTMPVKSTKMVQPPQVSIPHPLPNASLPDDPGVPGGQLAVINLHGTFADHHPSGIEPERLTINSIIGTLYANFPRIVEIRFLVDGRGRETLNGHIDLTRTYRSADTAAASSPETP